MSFSVAIESVSANQYPWANEDNPYASEWLALDRAIINAALKFLDGRRESAEDSESDVLIASIMLDQLRDVILLSPRSVIDDGLPLERYLPLYIEDQLPELEGYLRAVANNSSSVTTDDFINFLIAWIKSTRHALNFSVSALISEEQALKYWSARLGQIAAEAEASMKGERFVREAAQAAKSAERASVAARAAAGSAGNSALAVHFSELSIREARAALGWTVGTIFALAAVIGAGVILSVIKVYDSLWGSIIGHLAIILPTAAIAAYTARIGHHHRKSALWSSSASVQLKSIAAYAEQLESNESREGLLVSLGTRVFSAPDLVDATPTDQVSIVPPAFVDLVRELVAGIKQDPAEKPPPPSS